MLLTEDEAKKRWCPMVRIDGSNMTIDLDTGQRAGVTIGCIGAGCMAWRWQELQADDAYLAAVVKAAEEINDTSSSRSKAAKHVSQNRAKYGLPDKPYLGFCGMAGAH